MAVNSVVDAAASTVSSARLGRELDDLRGGLPALAARICGSRSSQEAIAGRSYWHPNGFVKLVLDERAGWGQLRLHVWPDAAGDDDIHDHAWRYESVVVGGDLREVRYREAAGAGHGRAMWRHAYGMTGHRRFTLQDPQPVTMVEDPVPLDLRTGDRSGGAPGHVHRFFATVAPAVTMLRVGPIIHRYSHVYRAESAPRQALAPQPTSRADVAEWADHVRTLVGPRA